MDVRLSLTGTRPLMVHNVQLASPMNAYSRKLAQLNRQKQSSKRTDDDRLEIARVEWEGGLYFDSTPLPNGGVIGPYAPSDWVWKSMLEAARTGRRGPKIEAGIAMNDLVNPLIYDGPRDIEELWGNGTSPFVDFRTVRVGQAKVDRCRPIFNEWRVYVDITVDTTVIDEMELLDIARLAGKLKGIGDYRQRYGRFEAEIVSAV